MKINRIESFKATFERAEKEGGYVVLDRENNLKTEKTGFLEKIFFWFRPKKPSTDQNEQVANAFLSALKEKYGEMFTEMLNLDKTRPLSSRQIQAIMEAGEEHVALIRSLNQYKIDELGNNTETFRSIFTSVAQQLGFEIPLDAIKIDKLTSDIRTSINRAGADGKHPVSTQEGYELAQNKIAEFIRQKQALLEQVRGLEVDEKTKAALRGFVLGHDNITGWVLNKVVECHDYGLNVLLNMSQGNIKEAMNQLKRLGTIIAQEAPSEPETFSAYEMLIKLALSSDRVNASQLYSALNTPKVRDLRGALNIYMELSDTHPETARNMGNIRDLVMHLVRLTGEFCNVPDADARAQLDVTFSKLVDVPYETASILNDILDFDLPRSSGLNTQWEGELSHRFCATIEKELNKAPVIREEKFIDNIFDVVIKDISRNAKYVVEGQTYSGVNAVEKFKKVLHENFSSQEIRTITALAHQGCFEPFFRLSATTNLGPFKALVGKDPYDEHPATRYVFGKNDKGDLLLEIYHRHGVAVLVDSSGEHTEQIELDPNRSYVEFEMSIKITKESIQSGNPRVEMVKPARCAYAFLTS
jgi:hypothetical protein